MVAAAIQFTQGALVGPVGQALEVQIGQPVVVQNGVVGGSIYTFEVLDAPPSSAITPGVKQGPGATTTWTFTPDFTDSYLIRLTVSDGTTSVQDTREVRVRRPTGRVIPSWQGASPNENYGGNARGWAPVMEEWLDYLDSLLPALHGVLAVTHSNSPQTLDANHQIAKVDSSTGTTTVNAPQVVGAIVSGWQILVYDDASSAGANPITVSGNGKQIEDPANPGSFAASVNLSVNSAAVVWQLDGTRWKVQSAYGFSTGSGGGGGGLQGVITVVHGVTGSLDQTHQIARVETGTGTTQVNAPVPGGKVVAGWMILVFDDQGAAAAGNPITVSGNGLQIEDPNNPGAFAASVQMTTGSAACGWVYTGAQWKLWDLLYATNLAGPLVFNVLPWAKGGREQGEIHVTLANSPQTLSPTVQLAYCESSTGPTTVRMPSAPTANLLAWVGDADGQAGANPITVDPNGSSTEDPNNPGTFTTATFTLAQGGASVLWRWDAVRLRFKIVAAVGFVAGANAPGALVTGTVTLTANDTFKLFGGSTVGNPTVIRLPVNPVANRTEVVLRHADATPLEGAGQATLDGNGKNVEDWSDPNNRTGVHAPAATVALTRSDATYRYRFDGTIWRSVS